MRRSNRWGVGVIFDDVFFYPILIIESRQSLVLIILQCPLYNLYRSIYNNVRPTHTLFSNIIYPPLKFEGDPIQPHKGRPNYLHTYKTHTQRCDMGSTWWDSTSINPSNHMFNLFVLLVTNTFLTLFFSARDVSHERDEVSLGHRMKLGHVYQ